MGRLRNNIKIARKSVFYDFRAYVWFFFAVFLIQVFLSSALLSIFNEDNASRAVGEGEYNYHIALKNINSDQRLLIENDRSTRFESGKFYDIQDVVVHDGNADRFDVYLTFRGDISASYSRFLSYYSEPLRQYGGGAGWYVSTVPELSDNASAGAGALKSVVVISAASFLCVLFLTALYSIRADYFKFSYGIFMTYGGGSKKIFSTSFYEMAVIALVCAIPSSVFSRILTGIIYSAAGFDFKASFSAYVISVLLSMILSAAALYLPSKRISRKTPVENLRAEDNSNYVTSP
ncbi:MAG: ABC transporter permease, partial [Clostridia bacterium]|nr:ABC transporter permease [Clostridia bacterium]